MLVPSDRRQICRASADCGLALSCRADGLCGPCTNDGDCLPGESCVLDHCVKRAAVTCRSSRDCKAAAPDALCVLSGITGNDIRGNGDMRAFCVSAAGPPAYLQSREEAQALRERSAKGEGVLPPVNEATLLKVLRDEHEMTGVTR